MGNVHLQWAFSEAAVLFLCHNAEGKRRLAQIQKKHGKGKALSILAHKIGRAVYYMLVRGTVFSMAKFLHASERGGERRGEPVSHTSNSSHETELAKIAPNRAPPSAARSSIMSHRSGNEIV